MNETENKVGEIITECLLDNFATIFNGYKLAEISIARTFSFSSFGGINGHIKQDVAEEPDKFES